MSRNGNRVLERKTAPENLRASKVICGHCSHVVLIPLGSGFPEFCHYCGALWRRDTKAADLVAKPARPSLAKRLLGALVDYWSLLVVLAFALVVIIGLLGE